jgi:hypothetical protein
MQVPSVAYIPAQWSTFLSAEVGASAALAGLLFVAVSINLSRIIANPHLTPRVVKALTSLAGIVFFASLCLVPGQSNSVLGSELIILGVLIWFIIIINQRQHARGNPYLSGFQKFFTSLLAHTSAIPLVVCGISLHFSAGGGLFWLVPAVLISFLSALLDAWVLLIEIQR